MSVVLSNHAWTSAVDPMSRKLTTMVLENQHNLALSNHDGSGAEDPMLSNFTVVVLENQNTLSDHGSQ